MMGRGCVAPKVGPEEAMADDGINIDGRPVGQSEGTGDWNLDQRGSTSLLSTEIPKNTSAIIRHLPLYCKHFHITLNSWGTIAKLLLSTHISKFHELKLMLTQLYTN